MTNAYIFPKLKIFFTCLLFCFLISCEKKEEVIPYTKVDFSINLDYAGYTILRSPFQSLEISGEGLNGVIIFSYSDSEFYAYERTCTYQVEKNCAVTVNPDDQIFAECPCCNSVFDLVHFGDAYKGPAQHNLKMYRTYLNGSILHIYN